MCGRSQSCVHLAGHSLFTRGKERQEQTYAIKHMWQACTRLERPYFDLKGWPMGKDADSTEPLEKSTLLSNSGVDIKTLQMLVFHKPPQSGSQTGNQDSHFTEHSRRCNTLWRMCMLCNFKPLAWQDCTTEPTFCDLAFPQHTAANSPKLVISCVQQAGYFTLV